MPTAARRTARAQLLPDPHRRAGAAVVGDRRAASRAPSAPGRLASRSQAEAAAAPSAPPSGCAAAGLLCPRTTAAAWPGCWAAATRPAAAARPRRAYAAAAAAACRVAAGRARRGPLPACASGWRALGADCRFEEAADLRDRLDALEGVRRTLAPAAAGGPPHRRAAGRRLDPRFVNAFACTGGRVVARRRLPRSGDGMLECRPLAAALSAARGAAAGPARLRPGRGRPRGRRRIRPPRPGRGGGADRGRGLDRAASLVAIRRGSVPFGDELRRSTGRCRLPQGLTLCVGLDPRIELLPPELVTGLKPGRAAARAPTSGSARADRFGRRRGGRREAAGCLLRGAGRARPRCARARLRRRRRARLLVIADAKRGDIDSTAEAYAEAWLAPRDGGRPVADALTVNPYLGGDSLEPVPCRPGQGAGLFVLARTSNPGGADLQEAMADDGRCGSGTAELIAQWGARTGRASPGCRAWRGRSAPPTRRRSSGALRADARAGAAAAGVGAQGGSAGIWPRRSATTRPADWWWRPVGHLRLAGAARRLAAGRARGGGGTARVHADLTVAHSARRRSPTQAADDRGMDTPSTGSPAGRIRSPRSSDCASSPTPPGSPS